MPTINRPLSKEVLRLGLGEELAKLTGAQVHDRFGRRARTLIKDGPLRVTLIALAPGGQIPAHTAVGPITIEALKGTITVVAKGEVNDLGAGELLALGARVEHAVSSAEGGAFLLTLALGSD